MAVTKIIPVRSTIEKSIDYICNPAKTDGGFFVHSEHCAPQTAALEFQNLLRQSRAGGNTIGRHLIQSFAPGEVDPATAHEIGIKLADEILKGKYAYVMATHVDRGHIHNHFVWCAADVVDHKRYRSNKNTYHEIRETSDRLCKDNSLSVIIPHGVGMGYTEYNAAKQGTSWKAKLRAVIDEGISETASFEDFFKRMEAQGYEIKHGKYISFRAPDQERFTRAKTLGEDYAEDIIKRRIYEKYLIQPDTKTAPAAPSIPIPAAPSPSKPAVPVAPSQPKPKSVIDIEGNAKIQASPGYKQWAKIYNLQQGAAALNAIQEMGGIAAFDELFKQAIGDKMDLAQKINGIDAEIKNLSSLRNTLHAYGRTIDVFRQYQAQGTDKLKEKFYQAHQNDIDIHRAVRKTLSTVKQPLPTVKTVTGKIDQLKASRTEADIQYKRTDAKLKEMEVTRKNLYSVIRQNRPVEKHKSNDLIM